MWCSKAASQGHAEAQFACYFEGDGVTVDKVAALEWWLKAAENGHATARFNVGIHYSAKSVRSRVRRVPRVTQCGGLGVDPQSRENKANRRRAMRWG